MLPVDDAFQEAEDEVTSGEDDVEVLAGVPVRGQGLAVDVVRVGGG